MTKNNKWEWTPALQRQLEALPAEKQDQFMADWHAQNEKLGGISPKQILDVVRSGRVKPSAYIELRRSPWWQFWHYSLRWRLIVKCCEKHEPIVYARFLDQRHGHYMALLVAKSLAKKYGDDAIASVSHDNKPEELIDFNKDD